MTYVWINPVVDKLYDPNALTQVLDTLGMTRFINQENHVQDVKNHYQEAVNLATTCVIDKRCPLAVQHVQSHYPNRSLTYPQIQPILIHAALEARKNCPSNALLYITTPCQSLAELGDSLALDNTIFLTWRAFVQKFKVQLTAKKLTASPIPPGFFELKTGQKIANLRSKNQIDFFFQQHQEETTALAEMLYCQDGCHNGDGVTDV
ncbi:hypothetical protein FACS1894193_00130 [Bacilli bacterium]|nr:hypothetical protein FACS1894193_00130 [Bacilli bacterium]